MPALDARNLPFLSAVAEFERRKSPESQQLFKKFEALAQHMLEVELKSIDIAMLIREGSVYTIHGISHVLDVIDNIGKLLGPTLECLDPGELYVLLCAAFLHDYGNIDGRADHTKKPADFVESHQLLFDTDWELRQAIIEVAEAHGGKALDGTSDTIVNMTLGARYQFLAAVLRLADELAENSSRTYPALIERGLIPDSSMPHHRYCRAIRSVSIRDYSVKLTLRLLDDDLPKRLFKGRDLSFIHYVDGRLAKTEMELRYTSRYMHPYMSRIVASVDVGLFEPSSTTRVKKSVPLRFEDDMAPASSFFQKCTFLQAKGIRTADELGKYLTSD